MNPTPVAWMYSDDNRGGTGVISFDRISHYKNEVALFTEAQLNQARANALREAAENIKRLIGGDGEIWVHEVDGLLSRMAAEIEGKKK